MTQTALPGENEQKPLQRAWLADGRIVHYTITSPLRATLDDWVALVHQTIAEWSPNKPYLALHDLTNPGVSYFYGRQTHFTLGLLGITEAGDKALNELLAGRPHFRSRVAVLLSLQHSGYVVGVLSARSVQRRADHQSMNYYQLDKALEWLQS